MRQLERNRSLILQGVDKVKEYKADCCTKNLTQMQQNFQQKLQLCGWKIFYEQKKKIHKKSVIC